MSEIINIPIFLTEDNNALSITPLACEDCEICQSLYQQCGSCEVCENCESGGCQTTCEASCQSSCEKGCEGYCENACVSMCENDCQSSCEINCESNCQDNCQTTCQVTCQTGLLPKLPTPTIDASATIKKGHSITITINPVAGATTYTAKITGISEQNSSSRTFSFTGLQLNTQYYIEIKCSGSGYEDSDWAGYYATTLPSEPWEWFTPKISGGDFNLTAEEWKAFCARINEIRVLNGLSLIDFTIDNPYLAKGNPFYAWIFKKAANAINEINGQVAAECLNVVPGDDIFAWYFENLKTALNNAI